MLNRICPVHTVYTLNIETPFKTPYHTTGLFYYLLMCLKTALLVANNIDPDQTLHSVASDLVLQFVQACLSKYLGLILYAY